MDEEELEIELIEAFIAKKLSAEESKQVADRIAMNVDFAQKVDDYTAIIRGIQSNGHTILQGDLRLWESELTNDYQGRKLFHWKTYFAVAAAVLIAVVAGSYFLFYKPNQPTGAQIFASNFKPYEDVVTVRGETEAQDALAHAMELYNEGNYQKAIPYFKAAQQKVPTADEPPFYLATSWLALHQPDKAIPLLLKLEESRSVFHDQAQWYLVLAYELQNNNHEATDRLRAIANDAAHSYSERAAEILEEQR